MDKTLKPIKEKGDMPKYQVTMRNYFSIPNQRAFDNVSHEGGRVIRGLAIMGFKKAVDYNKCMVGLAVRNDKGNNTKGGFNK